MNYYSCGNTPPDESEGFECVSIQSLLDEAVEAFEVMDKLLEPFGLEIELAETYDDMYYVKIVDRG